MNRHKMVSLRLGSIAAVEPRGACSQLPPMRNRARAQMARPSRLPRFTKRSPASTPPPSISAVDPCTDFYKFACGKFAANHPIPADQPAVDEFYALFNVNTQSLNGILLKAAAGGAGRTPNEQKIGDYYKSCMDTDAIEAKGLAPLKPLLDEIDAVNDKNDLAALAGKLQRNGIDVFFGYGEQQDFKDASKQIAFVDQAGLGLPERDYYIRTGAKDETVRKQYVDHVAKMLTLAGSYAGAGPEGCRSHHGLRDGSGQGLHACHRAARSRKDLSPADD